LGPLPDKYLTWVFCAKSPSKNKQDNNVNDVFLSMLLY